MHRFRQTALLALTLACIFSAVSAATAARPPNIVIFLSDDMGWGQLGYQGGKDVATPNIDRIAREGVQLTQ
ncbi:MAG TPA: sulfatase-like hydrolase/transferase, partial [Opitutaceae bacterium]|nr:sulfatase-like hydrolase/transferase [Opitutaceae bacterium]